MMKKMFLLSALLWMAGLSAGAQDSGRLKFGVISDTHFGSSNGIGAMKKVPQALRNLTSHGSLDALFVVGDITDRGRAAEYE